MASHKLATSQARNIQAFWHSQGHNKVKLRVKQDKTIPGLDDNWVIESNLTGKEKIKPSQNLTG